MGPMLLSEEMDTVEIRDKKGKLVSNSVIVYNTQEDILSVIDSQSAIVESMSISGLVKIAKQAQLDGYSGLGVSAVSVDKASSCACQSCAMATQVSISIEEAQTMQDCQCNCPCLCGWKPA